LTPETIDRSEWSGSAVVFLSDGDIHQAIERGEIQIDGFDPRLVKRNSYLLRLGDQFRMIQPTSVFDTAAPDDYLTKVGEVSRSGSIELTPDRLVLGVSLERIGLSPGLMGVLSGISNVARLGVLLHSTSEFVNAGFSFGSPSAVVFEMATIGGMRVRMYAGTPVCHLAFARLVTPTEYPEKSARTGQGAPDPSSLLDQFGHFFTPDAAE
jgi:dCTP deaminase